MSIAFVFSGQGAQYNEMGKDLYDQFPYVREIFDQASQELEVDLAEICFQEDERLHWTPITQPAILTLSHAIEQLVKQEGVKPEKVAGLSLGEYTALVSSGAFSFKDAVRLVHRRGTFMDQAVPDGEGKMAAIMGLNSEIVEEICQNISKISYVQPANYNMPGQLVIAGTKEGVELASKELDKTGAKKIVPLNVSGPFHTKLLEPAAKQLEKELNSTPIQTLTTPVYSNATGLAYTSDEDIIPLLVKQVMSPVRFEQMIRQMIADGTETFIEIGPGKTLRSFIKKIDRGVTVKNIENVKQLHKTIELFV
jgi:[acyl-carrier-protein] S-malonyltransferase